MAARVSRRLLARHIASRLLNGDTAVIEQLAAYLLEMRRTNEADLIIRDVEDALKESGIVIADVITAHELNEGLRKAISEYVTDKADAREVHIRTQSNPALLGGVRIQIPGAEYDGTVRRRLLKIQAMKV